MNKLHKITSALILAAGFALGATAFAHNGESHEKTAAPAADKAAPAYPLKTCVVSGDKLEDGDMGPPIDYVHKEAGKPDRLVRLCCKSCIKKFKQDPAKYLKMIDDAAAGKPAEAAPSGDAHGGHKH